MKEKDFCTRKYYKLVYHSQLCIWNTICIQANNNIQQKDINLQS